MTPGVSAADPATSSPGVAAASQAARSGTPWQQVAIDSQGRAQTHITTAEIGGPSASATESYIVELSAGASPSLAMPSFERTIGRPIAVTHSYSHAIRGFTTSLTTGEAARLRGDSSVLRIEPDQPVSVDTTEAAPSWGIDRIDQRALPLSGTYTYADTGAGVRAYVIDTGIYANSDFGARVATGISTVPGDSSTVDCHGHGTHVAGIIGGSVYGVAKGVTLVPVRVLDCSGSGWNSGIIAGIDWMIADHKAGTPAVANMSLGGIASPAMNDAVRSAVAAGIVMSVAAGNSATDACAFSPASEPSALTVAATDNADSSATFSNEGMCVDLFAPGVNIVSDYNTSATATKTMSGTSMASPHVTGIAALYAARFPSASVQEIEDALLADATAGAVKARDPLTPNRLAFIGPPTVAPKQRLLFSLPALYLDGGLVHLAAAASSGLPVSFSSLTPTTCSVAGSSATPLAAGTCTIKASQAGNTTYNATTATVSGLVYPHRQTIDAGALSDLVYGHTAAIGAASTSGLPVAYTSVSPMICSTQAGTVTALMRGFCQIRATQPGNATYGPAPQVVLGFSVVAASQQLSPGSHANPPYAGISIPYVPTSSAGYGVGVTSLTPSICTAAAGKLKGLAGGTCKLTLSQVGDENVLPATAAHIQPVTDESVWFGDIAIGPGGLPVIAYSNGPELYLAYCSSVACSSRRTIDLGATGLAVQALSLAVAGDGRAVVAYSQTMAIQRPDQDYLDVDDVLWVTACKDVTCTSWTNTMVDVATLGVGESGVAVISIKLSPKGLPVIAYDGLSAGSHGVGLAICADFGCTASTTLQSVADAWPGDYGVAPALAFGTNGLPIVAYLRGTANLVRGNLEEWATAVVAICLDATCATKSTTELGPAYRFYQPAIVVLPDGRPVVFWTDNDQPHDSYQYADLVVRRASCTTPDCHAITAGIFDRSSGVNGRTWSYAGGDISATLGSTGQPVVTYYANYVAGGSYFPRVVVSRACLDTDCLSFSPGYVDQFTDSPSVLIRAVPKIASLPGGGVAIVYGVPPASYAGSDPRWIGLRLATCVDNDCSIHDSLPVKVDKVPPVVTSFTASTASPTTASSIAFNLKFSEAVTGLAAGDFALSGTSTGWSIAQVAGTGSSYTVTVTSSQPRGGTIVLRLAAQSVRDPANNGGPAAAIAAPAVTWSGATFMTLTPNRLVDTRSAVGISSKLLAGKPRTFTVINRSTLASKKVPSNAIAVTGILTVTGQTAKGYLSLTPSSPTGTPTTSTLNFPLGDTRATSVIVALGPGGTLAVTYVGAAGSSAQVIFDVTGYFVPGTSGATFMTLTPNRLVDTRSAVGISSKLLAGKPRTFTVINRSTLASKKVPSNAIAVTGILTVTGQTAKGYLSLTPSSPTGTPTTSTLNFPLGDTRATSVIVALGPGGTLAVTYVGAAGSSAQVIFDVTGYFVPGTSGATFMTLTPNRLVDTRSAVGISSKLLAGKPRTFTVINRSTLASKKVPSNAIAVTGILTVTGQTAKGYLSLTPSSPTGTPTTSTLNFPTGDTRATSVVVALGPGGTLAVTYVGPAGSSAQVIFDVTGYFVPGP